MDPHHEVLERTCELLGRVPGVVVHAHWQEREVACMEFSVQIAESAAALERIAMGANVPNRPRSQSPLSVGRHTFAASTEHRDLFASGNLQLLAIHLTWYLHRVGRLATHEANQWLGTWSAVAVDG
jgi:hypothetical protein